MVGREVDCTRTVRESTPRTLASFTFRNTSTASGSPLRVAVLAPIAWRTPPRHYGPWELFASLLTEGLVAAGHDVTLFATADSVTTATLHATAARGWSEDDSIDPKVAECLHIASVFERADEFDIIHNGFDFLPLTYSGLVDTPVVTTIHGFSSPRIVPVYERYDATTTYVAISDADRHPRSALRRDDPPRHRHGTRSLSTRPRRPPAVLRADPPRQGHRARDRGRPANRPPARHRRHHPGRASTSATRSSRTSTANTSATSARSTRPTDRRHSAQPTPCCTSSTSTSRSASASSRRWHAGRRSSPTTAARWPRSSSTARPGFLVDDIDGAVRGDNARRRARSRRDSLADVCTFRRVDDGRSICRGVPNGAPSQTPRK